MIFYIKRAFVMELVDILVLGTSAAKRAGSSPAEGKNKLKRKGIFVLKKKQQLKTYLLR